MTPTDDLTEHDPNTDQETLDRHQLTVSNLRDRVDPDDIDEVAIADLGRALNKLARLHAMRRDYAPAVLAQTEANQIWTQLERNKALFLGRMNANRWKFRNQEEISDWAQFRAEIDADETLEVYRDFVWEFEGRCAFSTGDYDRCRACLTNALQIREERGRAERIIEATRAMIRTVESLAFQNGN